MIEMIRRYRLKSQLLDYPKSSKQDRIDALAPFKNKLDIKGLFWVIAVFLLFWYISMG